jgi:hypothetical protein
VQTVERSPALRSDGFGMQVLIDDLRRRQRAAARTNQGRNDG